MNIQELVYSPEHGHDIEVSIPLAYNAKAYKTKAGAARGLHKALTKLAVAMGQKPSEVLLWSPDEAAKSYAHTRQWMVVWEAGPFQWAIPASFEITGPWGFCEPYYSFDLCFTD